MSKTVSAIVPAYNEEKNIRRVLEVLEKAQILGIISEIIVIDDGSEDETSKKALNFGIKLLRITENRGKARAMSEGLKIATGDFSLFIDADLVGLNVEHVLKLIKTIQEKGNCMAIARFTNGRLSTDIAHTLNIDCSGQRVAKTEVFKKVFATIKKINRVRYGIENIITGRLKDFEIQPVIVEWEGVSQVLKEEKWGFFMGSYLRVKMYVSMNLGHLRNFFYRIFKLLDIKETSD